MIVGAVGVFPGVALEAEELAPSPAALTASILTLYCVPLVSSDIVIELLVLCGVTACQLP